MHQWLKHGLSTSAAQEPMVAEAAFGAYRHSGHVGGQPVRLLSHSKKWGKEMFNWTDVQQLQGEGRWRT